MSEQKKAASYSISHITDLLSVPDDRLDECLDSMKQMIHTMRLVTDAAIAVHQEKYNLVLNENSKRAFIALRLPVMTWVDDGTNDSTVTSQGKTLLSVKTAFATKPKDTNEGRATRK